MNRFNRSVTRIFLSLSPIAAMVFLLDSWESTRGWLHIKAVSWVIGSLFVVWFISGVYFFVGITLSPGFRETVLTRLANLKERDEREEKIVGYASRQTFLFMLSVLLGLFAASTVRFGESVQNPHDRNYQSITIGHWGILDARSEITSQTRDGKSEEVRLYDMPLSKSGLLLLLLVLHLAMYQMSSRRVVSRR